METADLQEQQDTGRTLDLLSTPSYHLWPSTCNGQKSKAKEDASMQSGRHWIVQCVKQLKGPAVSHRSPKGTIYIFPFPDPLSIVFPFSTSISLSLSLMAALAFVALVLAMTGGSGELLVHLDSSFRISCNELPLLEIFFLFWPLLLVFLPFDELKVWLFISFSSS